ncbi:MAG: 1-deoxy-D-xylulose-5-phosphate reductoisomerase [Planctomycetes bacterium]|nr:1-deoxy-D-xylulose-5-phosphate reductoisomerase [Planctomycetota bacterium]
MKRIAVLGSTGSVGTNCLQVLAALPERLSLSGITAHRRWRELAEQSKSNHPRWAVVTDDSLSEAVDREAFSTKTELLFGESGIERLCSAPEVDVVVSAIVGAAGLRGTWIALECGKTVAIANKETLVVAGSLVMELAKRTNARLIPVDSEHSAIFQALQAGRTSEVKRVVLTSSGGPFRGRTAAQLQGVTPSEALAHPTWNMGPKITIDSATMMNKALEVIEAKWLFSLRDDQIEVVVHPQSVVHSFVEFVDGSVIAQLSPPDMRLPIQYALTFPDRCESIATPLDWKKAFGLHFEPPDLDAFPALRLGFEVASRGGTCGAVLNAANEAAVERFLAGNLCFCDIPRACRAVLDQHDFDASPSLSELLRLDREARQEIARWT